MERQMVHLSGLTFQGVLSPSASQLSDAGAGAVIRRRCHNGMTIVSRTGCGSAVQAALSDTCSANVNDLFPQQYNVTEIHAALNRTNSPALAALLPSPFVGFTLILAGDQAFAIAKSASCELRNSPSTCTGRKAKKGCIPRMLMQIMS